MVPTIQILRRLTDAADLNLPSFTALEKGDSYTRAGQSKFIPVTPSLTLNKAQIT